MNTTKDIGRKYLEALRNVGYHIDEETIYLGKLRLIHGELPGSRSSCRVPNFDKCEYFFHGDKGLYYRSIRNTSMTQDMDDLKGYALYL